MNANWVIQYLKEKDCNVSDLFVSSMEYLGGKSFDFQIPTVFKSTNTEKSQLVNWFVTCVSESANIHCVVFSSGYISFGVKKWDFNNTSDFERIDMLINFVEVAMNDQ